MSFDDGPQTQLIGLHMFANETTNAYAEASSVTGNVTYGNVNFALFEDDVNADILHQDDTNAVLANNEWRECSHQISKGPVSPTTLLLLRDVTVPSAYMLTRCGLRISAAGTVSGNAGDKTFELGFGGTANNVFSITVPASLNKWSFVSTVMNYENDAAAQVATTCFCSGEAVLAVFENTLAIETQVTSQAMELWVQVANSDDSITSDYFNIARC
jgi:hypothetical protein